MKRVKISKSEDDSQEMETSERVNQVSASSSTSTSTSSSYSTLLEIQIPNLHIIFSDLLPIVLSGVETADLIRFRLVSKFWKMCSDRLLMKRRDQKLVFKFSHHQQQNQKNKFVLKRRRRRKTETENQELDENGSENSDSDSDCGESENPENENRVFKETDFSLSRFLCRFSPTSFPCVRFGFIGRKFHEKDIQAFFSKYSGRVKEVSLKWDKRSNIVGMNGLIRRRVLEKWTTHQTLVELLIGKKLTHLETLQVSGDFSRTGNKIFEKVLQSAVKNSLPSLKTLRVKSCADKETRQIIQTLLSTGAAPNLKAIPLVNFMDARKILPFFTPVEVKLFSIQEFHINVFSVSFSIEMVQVITRFFTGNSTGSGSLEKLWLFVSRPPISRGAAEGALRSFETLLLKSRDSLKSIVLPFAGFVFMMNALVFVPDISFINVKHLHFHSRVDENLGEIFRPECFPLMSQVLASLSLKTPFPCLNTVTVDGLAENVERWFPFVNEKLETVKRLNILGTSRQLQLPYARAVLRMFPNLETLRNWNLFNFPELATSIWEMRSLKHLDLLIHIGTNVEDNLFPNLDCAFTGFSHETVYLILGANLQAEQEPELDILRELRENPSILDLKNLRTFKLNFSDRYGPVTTYNFITRVTWDFAFKWMKRVQIHIKITPPKDLRSWDKSRFVVASLDNVTVKLGRP